MRSCFIFGWFFFLSAGIVAQSPSRPANQSADPIGRVTTSAPGEGKVTITQSPGMEELLQNHISMNKRAEGIEGFRVQLYSGSGSHARQQAMEVKSQVLKQLPSNQIFVEYNAPFWRVRAGSFRHKHEALPMLHQLRPEFPNCYVVKDFDLKLSDLP